MKIVIVGTAYPLRGGIAHFNALLASHLSKRHDVETITFKRQYPKLLFPGKTQNEEGDINGVQAAPQIVDSINPFNWFLTAREIVRRGPDIVIFKYWLPFFGPCFGTIAKLVKRRTDSRVLFVCDNIIPHEHRPCDIAFTKYAFKQADYFIVQSDSVEKDLKYYFPRAVYRKVPHPVYENFGTVIPKKKACEALGITAKKVILFFGYIRPYKGLTVLLKAMEKIDDVLLYVVGEFYDDENKYRKMVAELNIGTRVKFVPDYVPNDRVALYFSASDIIVLPYLTATQSGITQIAYNFDKPVIATDVGGLAEVVLDGKTGFIVPPGDPDKLADAVRKFYCEQRGSEFVANVRLEKIKYSWDNFIRNIEELADGKSRVSDQK